jgi:hypothetical protein
MTDFPDRYTDFSLRNTEQSFYEDSKSWSDNIGGWVIAIAGAILIVFGLIYQFGGVSMDHPQNNPAAINQPAKPAPPTTSPKLPAPIPQ